MTPFYAERIRQVDRLCDQAELDATPETVPGLDCGLVVALSILEGVRMAEWSDPEPEGLLPGALADADIACSSIAGLLHVAAGLRRRAG